MGKFKIPNPPSIQSYLRTRIPRWMIGLLFVLAAAVIFVSYKLYLKIDITHKQNEIICELVRQDGLLKQENEQLRLRLSAFDKNYNKWNEERAKKKAEKKKAEKKKVE